MSHVVTINAQGKLEYSGLLSSMEKATIDDILRALQNDIPQIESDLAEEYGNGVQYKYNLGKVLNELLDKYKISVSERRKFWDEIKMMASEENRKRNEGKNAVTRSFYEQCYKLSQLGDKYGVGIIDKMSWKQWQDILDRKVNREDERIFLWINNLKEKLSSKDFPEFEKGLNVYLKNVDTSVFEDDELLKIYDSILLMAKEWNRMFAVYKSKHPDSAKVKNKLKWSRNFYKKCFSLKKEKQVALVDTAICKEAFTISIG